MSSNVTESSIRKRQSNSTRERCMYFLLRAVAQGVHPMTEGEMGQMGEMGEGE